MATSVSQRLTISSSFCAPVSVPRSGSGGGRLMVLVMVWASWNDRSVGDVHHLRRLTGKREIMRDKHQRRPAFAVDLQEQRHDLALGLDVEIGGRLVREQQKRIVDERPRDRSAALLASRHLRWIGVEMRSQSKIRQQLRGALIGVSGCAVAAEQRR